MRGTRAVMVVVAVVFLAGCRQDDRDGGGAVSGMKAGEADQLNAQRSRFETSQDPPVAAETHFAAAQLAESQENWPRAIEQYDKTIKLDPKHTRAMYRLGIAYARSKMYPEAIATWNLYVKATNGAATGYSNLGFCCELAGQLAEAEAAYKKGIERDPKNRPCRVNYGLMLARNARIGEATTHLQAVLTPAEVHYNLGSIYEQRGRKDQAKVEYRQALELDPNFADARARLSALD